MAAVYSATHRNGTPAAVKVLHPELSSQPSMRERFHRESHLANLVDHRGAVEVFDDHEEAEDGCVYLVMGLLVGEPLDQRAARAPLSTDEILLIADQVLDVLIAAHGKGIVHRDIKPDNLFLIEDGSVRVLDFGIAAQRSPDRILDDTVPGTPMGTPAFMPPEQARGLWDLVDARSDLWALAATLYTLLCGRFVHPGETTNEVLFTAMIDPVISLALALPGAPGSLVAVIDRALALDMNERWPNALAMQAALRSVSAEIHGDSSLALPIPVAYCPAVAREPAGLPTLPSVALTIPGLAALVEILEAPSGPDVPAHYPEASTMPEVSAPG
jgi:serine/threonine-protein kinase